MARVDELFAVLARATPCDRLTLLVYAVAKGRLSATTWSGSVPLRTETVVPSFHSTASVLGVAPLLSPESYERSVVVVVSRSELVATGWLLEARSRFEPLDVAVVATLVPLLVTAVPGFALDRDLPQSRLTHRETDILLLVGQGLTAKSVAHRLGISVRTVNKHLEHAYRKIGCHDRVSAVQFLHRAGGLSSQPLPTSSELLPVPHREPPVPVH